MNLKELFLQDIDNNFLNLTEFGEIITLNGAEIKAVKSSAGLEAYKSSEYVAIHGVATRFERVSLKASDLPENVFISATVYINGEAAKVKEIDDRHGMTSLVLQYVGGR